MSYSTGNYMSDWLAYAEYQQDIAIVRECAEDRVTDAISRGLINSDNISYGVIRNLAGSDNGLRNSLRDGTAVLKNCDQSDQHLFTYGPMIKAQWGHVLSGFELSGEDIEIVDYGCGQGLGTMLLLDKCERALRERVRKVTLIDASSVAVQRAQSILECYCPEANVSALNNWIDDLRTEQLAPLGGLSKVHLFSNILDIDTFEQLRLARKILSAPGKHIFLAASRDRNFDCESTIIEALFDMLENESHCGRPEICRAHLDRISCGMDRPAISMIVKAEVA